MKHNMMKLASSLVLFAFVFSRPGFADDSELLNLVKGLQDQMKDMQKTISQQNDKINQQNAEIRQLQRREPQVQVAAPTGEAPKAAPMSDYEFNQMLDNATGGAQKWLKDLKFSGDMRLRYEGLHFSKGNPSHTSDRNRFRLRLRYGFEKTFNQDMKVGFSMASGAQSAGDNNDPISTNATFTNNFNFKPIFIEKAYATYTPHQLAKHGILDKTEVTAGKFTNPFEKGASDMVWDPDAKPEGIYEKFDWKLLETDSFNLNAYTTAGQFVLHEDATLGKDANLYAVQVGVNPVVYTPFFDRPVDFLSAFSFYDFNNFARQNNFLIGSTSLANGNPNVDSYSTELDAGKFKIFESYNELAVYPMGIPTRFSLDIAGNPADGADGSRGNTLLYKTANDLAYGLGLKLGGIVKKGDWQVLYQYKYIGANSVVGAFADSDFGSGGVGKKGSVIKLGYALTDSLTLNGSMFLVQNLNADSANIIDQQQRRFQLDLVWKF